MNGHSHLNGHSLMTGHIEQSTTILSKPHPLHAVIATARLDLLHTSSSSPLGHHCLSRRPHRSTSNKLSPPPPSPKPSDPYTISYTLATRPVHRQLSFCIASSLAPRQPPSSSHAPRRVLDGPTPPLVWCFSGQGPQHPDMGRTLYSLHPAYSVHRSTRWTRCTLLCKRRYFDGEATWACLAAVRGDPQAVYTLQYTLPSLVMLQTALCDLWRSWGVRPAAVFGHSFGEMAAAYAAGVCSKRQLIETAYHRAKLLSRIDGNGVMMAVGCSPAQIQASAGPARGPAPG